jgi:hypothetical protein
MRFMMIMIPKGYETAAPGTLPDPSAIAVMGKYNETLQKAGVLLELNGLHPPSMGARVSFAGGKPKVVDGPFAEAKEVVGGYWLIQVKSHEEAVEWASRCPASHNDIIEVRQVMDFPGTSIRFMMLMFEKGYETAAPGTLPDPSVIAVMGKYNETLQKAGVLLDVEGLHPPSMGARVSFAGGKPKVADSPFAEAKEVVGGYWIIQVKSKEEAVEWASRCPASENDVIAVRKVMETSDLPQGAS